MYIATVEWEDYGNEYYKNLCVLNVLNDKAIDDILLHINEWGINEFGCDLDDATADEIKNKIKGKKPPFFVEFGERSSLKIYDIDVLE